MIVPLAYSAEAAARLRRPGANFPSLKLRGISSEALAKEEASGDTLRSGKALHQDRSWEWLATRSSGEIPERRVVEPKGIEPSTS
jgi:hypothetical protein